MTDGRVGAGPPRWSAPPCGVARPRLRAAWTRSSPPSSRSCWRTGVVIAVLARDWDQHSTFEERELARARKRAEKWERSDDARERDRVHWEAHRARQAKRGPSSKCVRHPRTGFLRVLAMRYSVRTRTSELTSRGRLAARRPRPWLSRAPPSLPGRRRPRPAGTRAPRPGGTPCHDPSHDGPAAAARASLPESDGADSTGSPGPSSPRPAHRSAPCSAPSCPAPPASAGSAGGAAADHPAGRAHTAQWLSLHRCWTSAHRAPGPAVPAGGRRGGRPSTHGHAPGAEAIPRWGQ